jgi:hypothetical protein
MSRPARLTADLLVRKGEAMPATRLAQPTFGHRPPLLAAAAQARPQTSGAVIPLGVSPGTTQRYADARTGLAAAATPPGGDERVALTLRLDRMRHTRLRIFAARHQATSQDVLVRALDAYMRNCGGDCPCLRDASAESLDGDD